MKLTYKPGKLHKIHIYVDDEYRLTVDDEYWFSEKWHNLKEIDDGELAALEEAVSFPMCWWIQRVSCSEWLCFISLSELS